MPVPPIRMSRPAPFWTSRTNAIMVAISPATHQLRAKKATVTTTNRSWPFQSHRGLTPFRSSNSLPFRDKQPAFASANVGLFVFD